MTPTQYVPLHEIAANPWNPHGMKPEEFAALRESVREKGVWRPIVVIEMDQPDSQTPHPEAPYRVIDGAHLLKALVAEHLEHGGPDTALVLVYGKNSEVPVDQQMEMGQTINHGLRGTLEDTEKTGRIVEILAQTRTVEDIARRTGQSLSFLESARRIADPVARREAASSPALSRAGGDRVGSTVPLVFEDNASLQAYQTHVKPWELSVDPEGALTPGRRRIAAVLAALRAGPTEELL